MRAEKMEIALEQACRKVFYCCALVLTVYEHKALQTLIVAFGPKGSKQWDDEENYVINKWLYLFRDVRSSGMLRSVDWQLVTEVPGKPSGTGRLSRNVGD
jgi:hypothetical protein